MQQIDLKKFALHSQKIHSTFLYSEEKKNTSASTLKILLSHFIDFGCAFIATNLMASLYNMTVSTLLVTHGLQKAFSSQDIGKLSVALFPVILFSYFFTSYFMNDGQSWGMYLMKYRLEMKAKSFKETLYWANKSLLLCFSAGLTYLFQRPSWQNAKGHDHLYHSLMLHKEIKYDLMAIVKAEDQEFDFEMDQAA